jgi:hypothetical protein
MKIPSAGGCTGEAAAMSISSGNATGSKSSPAEEELVCFAVEEMMARTKHGIWNVDSFQF